MSWNVMLHSNNFVAVKFNMMLPGKFRINYYTQIFNKVLHL